MIPATPQLNSIAASVAATVPMAFDMPLQPLSAQEGTDAKEMAKKLLSGDPAFAHDETAFRYFGMFQCATAIKGSEFEGGSARDAFNYWDKILNLPDDGFPVKHGLTKDQLQMAREANKDLIEFEPFMVLEENPQKFKENAKKIIEKIRARCKANGSCYIPAGWNGIDGGHYVTLKARLLDDGRLAFHYLNYGEGIQHHQKVQPTPTKAKPDFRSEEYAMGQHECEDFIQRLILIRRDTRPFDKTKIKLDDKATTTNLSIIKQVGGNDLYALLPLLGDRIENKDRKCVGVTPQRSGTCPMQNTRATTTDAIMSKGHLGSKQLKRVQFSFKLVSIVEAFKAYQAKQIPHDYTHIGFLRNALHELHVRCEKLTPQVLDSQELALSQEIAKQISLVLDNDTKMLLAEACKPHQAPSLTGPTIQGSNRFEFEAKVAEETKEQDSKVRSEEEEKKTAEERSLKIATPKPSEVLQYVKNILNIPTSDGSKLNECDLMNLHQLMISLPTSSGQSQDSYWDLVPDNHIEKLIIQLWNITKNVLGFDVLILANKGLNKIYSSEISLIAYDIAAQLFPRCQLLQGFAFELSDVYQDQYFFHDADSYLRVKKIIENFKTRCHGKKPIFGNIISEGDATQSFLMHPRVFTRDKKMEWCLQKKGKHNPAGYSDSDIFTDLLTQNGLKEPYFDPTLIAIIRMSISAHSFSSNDGQYTQKIVVPSYPIVQGAKCVYVAFESNAYRELRGNRDLHLPISNKQTYLENSAFYPPKLALKEEDEKNKADRNFVYKPVGSHRLDYEDQYTTAQNAIGPIADEEFRMIEAHPKLQVQKSLEWAQYNLHRLSEPAVQVRLFTLLFEYDKIEDALKSAPEDLVTMIRVFQEKAFEYYLEEHYDLSTLLWLTSLCHYLKAHLVTSAHPFPEVDWIDTRAILKTLFDKATNLKERGRIAQQVVHSYLHESELTDRDALSILQYAGISLLADKDKGDPVTYSVHKILIRHATRIREAVLANLDAFANETIKISEGVTIDRKWHFQGNQIVDDQNEFRIALKSGNVTRSARSLRNIFKQIKTDNPWLGCMIDCLENQQPMLIQEKGFDKEGTLIITATSPNGEWELQINTVRYITQKLLEIVAIKRFMVIQGKRIEFMNKAARQNEAATRTKVAQLFPPYSADEAFCFESVNYPGCYIMFPEVMDPDVGYIYRPKIGWQKIHKESNEWKLGNSFYLDLRQESDEFKPTDAFGNAWGKFLKHFDLPCYISVEAIEERGQLTVSKIEFMRLGLSFKPVLRGSKYLLESQEYKGFYLDLDRKSLAELNGIQTGFFLKNDKGEKHLLLPAFPFARCEKSQVFRNPCYLFHGGDLVTAAVSGPPFFSYHLIDGKLVGSNSEANLYLSVFYAVQEDYPRAMVALENADKHTRNTDVEWAIAQELCDLKNKSAHGAAFVCHVAYRMYIHEKKWVKGARDSEKMPLITSEMRLNSWPQTRIARQKPHAIFIFAREQYGYYLENISAYKTDVSSIPIELRLHERQLRTIEYFLEVSRDVIERIRDNNNRRSTLDERLRLMTYGANIKVDWFDEGEQKEMEERVPFVRICCDPKATVKYKFFPAQYYAKKHFLSLVQDATSKDDPYRRKRFLADWYYLAMNSHETDLELNNILVVLWSTYNSGVVPQPTLTKAGQVFGYLLKMRKNGSPFDMHRGDLTVEKIVSPHAHTELNGQNLTFALNTDSINQNVLEARPLGAFALQYFDVQFKTVNQGAFPLKAETEAETKEVDQLGKLKQRLLKRYEFGDGSADKKPKKRIKEIYSFKAAQSKKELQGRLEAKKAEDIGLKNNLERELLELANKDPEFEVGASIDRTRGILQQAAYRGGQRRPIEIGDLIMSMLKKNPAILTKKNCFLTQAKLQVIYAKLTEYCLIKSRIDQANDALKNINESDEKWEVANEQLVGSILNKERTFKVEEHPEFLVYEYATGNMLRPDQVEALLWAIEKIESNDVKPEEYCHLLMQFAAAGGKTAVMIPILAHRFASKGALSVILNTPEMYNIGIKDIPESLKMAFKQQMEVLEIEKEADLTVAKLKDLLKNLQEWAADGKVLLMTPTAWNLINVAKKMAYIENDDKNTKLGLIKAAKDVLDFFKEKAIKFEDESHIISDSLQQFIRTFGPMQKLSDDQKLLFMRFYDYLFGRDDVLEQDEKESAEARSARVTAVKELVQLSGMTSAAKKIVNDNDLVKIQTTLAREICRDPLLAGASSRDDLYNYLMAPSKKKPAWLEKLSQGTVHDKQMASLVVCARSFIKTHLPHVLKMQLGKNYGSSIHKGDMTAAPKHEGMDTTAHFADPLLKMSLTIQLAEQEGVPVEFTEMILQDLKKRHNDQKKWCHEGGTLAEQFFSSLLPEGKKHFVLDKLTERQIRELSSDAGYRMQRRFVREYIYNYALRQIEVPLYRVSSTPAELKAGFRKGINFSATPGLLETYPVTLTKENARFELEFEREAMETLLDPKNGESCILKTSQLTAESFFQELLAKFPDLSSLIDRGALFCNEKPETIIAAYHKVSDRAKSGLYFSGQEMLLQHKGVDDKVRLAGSRIVQELRKQNIKYETLALFLYLQLKNTTGSDVQQAYTACGGLTVGPGQTITETIQAAMRQRLLLAEKGQTIVWVLLEALYKEINPNAKTFDPKGLFLWMLHNEAVQLEKKLIMRAYQGIDQIMKGPVWKKIDQTTRDKNIHFLHAFYKPLLVETMNFDPYHMYELETEEMPSATVLEAYIKQIRDKYYLGDAEELPLTDQEKASLALIVSQTQALIEKLTQPHGVELNGEVYQEQTMQQQEQNQDQEMNQNLQIFQNIDVNSQFQFQEEFYTPEKDGLAVPNFLMKDFAPEYRQYDFGQAGVSVDRLPPLIVHRSYLSPMQGKASSEFTKPITNILMQILTDGTHRFLACTAKAAEFYVEEFQRAKAAGTRFNAKYALIGFDNHILCSYGLNEEDRRTIPELDVVVQMTTYAAFLNGRIKNPYVLKSIIDQYKWSYKEYKAIADIIASRHVSKQSMELMGNRVLESLCGWYGEKGMFVGSLLRKVVQLRSNLPHLRLIPKPNEKNPDVKLDMPLPPKVDLRRRTIRQRLSSAWSWLSKKLLSFFCCRCRCR